MRWRERGEQALIGAAAGGALNLVYVGCIAGGIENKDWLQFIGAIFGAAIGVALTIRGTIALEEWKFRKAEEALAENLVNDLDRAEESLSRIVARNPGEWRHLASTAQAIRNISSTSLMMHRKPFELHVALEALFAAWEAARPNMERIADNELHVAHKLQELRTEAAHIARFLGEVRQSLPETANAATPKSTGSRGTVPGYITPPDTAS